MSARQQVKLLTFASERFYDQQNVLNRSAPTGGVTECLAWSQTKLKSTEFYRAHREILDAPRGCGFWLWKPYLILCELERLKPGDFLVYYDVGRPSLPNRISRPLHPLLEWCERQNAGLLPGIYIPEHGPNAKWTKRECFVLMNCDHSVYWNHPQVQATYSVWQKSEQSLTLVDEWLKWCTTPGVLTDAVALPHVKNFPEFVEHRHDQSIITNLAIKYNIKCYGDPHVSLPRSKDINNLVDRLTGKETAVFCRNVCRTAEQAFRWGLRRLKTQFLPNASQ